MKKYFTNDGANKMGPFTIEELQEQQISGDTPVWHDGLSDWTAANALAELKQIVASTPPPINKPTPPPINHSRQRVEEPVPQKKTNTLLITLILAFVFGASIWAGYTFMQNQESLPGVKIEINTPKPRVVRTNADRANADLFKERLTVYTTIQNLGGKGNVIVTFHVYQGGKHFERTKIAYLNADEIQDFEATFDEVRRLNGDMTYSAEVKAE